jgi:hypothetical protein
MPQISKAQIEALEKLIMCTTKSDNANKALVMLQGLLDQPEQMPVNNTFLTTPEMAAFNRFLETCEDGEGYDVPKTMMQRLAQIGVVRHLSRGIYNITEFGQSVIDPAPFTHITTDDVTDEMMANFIRGHTDNMTYAKTFAAAVNAYMKGK